jgi:two-component system chemotaxis response regulator CheY
MTTTNSPRALVVEDDRLLREQVSATLRENGYEVEEAVDGVDGIGRLASKQSFDVILLDLMMPRLDGYSVIDFLLLRQPSLLPRVIVMSSRSESVFRSICCTLKKPFETATLLERVERCVVAANQDAAPD